MAVAYFDSGSGLARIGIFTEQSPAQPHMVDFTIAVDRDMVTVGGGVVGNENPGKLLTASYPSADLSSRRITSPRARRVSPRTPVPGAPRCARPQ